MGLQAHGVSLLLQAERSETSEAATLAATAWEKAAIVSGEMSPASAGIHGPMLAASRLMA